MADEIQTKNITTVDTITSIDDSDKVFVNDNGSFKQISVSNLMKQAPSGVTEETDPTVSEWAKQPTKPSYTADEVGALPVGTKIPTKTSDLTNDSGYLTQIPEEYVTETELGQKGYVIEDDIPEKLPSPGTLTFTGAVNDTYDGSVNKTINIPTGGGEGGTSDYNALANKPKLNGVEIAGNKTSTDYKIVSSEQGIENNGKFLGVGVDGNVTPVDKPTYTADEVGARPDTWTPSAEDVGALPNDTEIPSKTSDLENDNGFVTNSDIPKTLPNPQKLIFSGAVTGEYDGSAELNVNIPESSGGGTTNYNNLSNKPQLNGVTLEGNKTLDQVGVLAKNQGASNSGKYLSVGSDGNVVPADAPSGGTVDPEQIKQAVNGYLEENPPSGMTTEEKEQLDKNTEDISSLSEEIAKLQTSGLTTAQVNALDGMFKKCAFTGNVSAEYTAFKQAFGIESGGGEEEPTDKTLTSISATYTGGDVTEGTALTDLTGITVTAHYSDGSTANVTGYTLSGTIAEGENTITVSYKGKTTTFKVNGVNESPSGIELMSKENIVANNYLIAKNAEYRFYQLSNKENCNVYEIPVDEGITYIASLTNNNRYGMPNWDTNQLNKVNSNVSFSISANKFTKFDTEERVTVDLDSNTILNTELASTTIDNKDGTYTRSIEFTPAITGYLYTDNRTSNIIYSIKKKVGK